MKTSALSVDHPGSKINSSAKPKTYLVRRRSSLILWVGFSAVFVLAIAAALYTSSSVSAARNSSRDNVRPNGVSGKIDHLAAPSPTWQQRPSLLKSSRLFSALLPLPQPVPTPSTDESIATFEVSGVNCTNTPKTTFVLGDKVCARASNAPLRSPSALRRFNWSDTKGFIRQSEDVVTDPDTNIYTLPINNTSVIDGVTVDNRGTWAASLNSTGDNTTRAIAYFTVSDPANLSSDLVIYNFSTAGDPIEPGTNTSFFLWLSNTGPDAATNVHLTMVVPPYMTFVSPATTSSAFVCTETGGIVDCSLPGTNPSWASGAVATITLDFSVSGGAPNGVISSTANIGSDTNDPRPTSNSSDASVEVRAAGAPPATCAT